MHIAQIAPLFESVPPKYYGGTERVVSYLTEELIRQGHEVTLFASGDSITRARLIAPCKRSLRLNRECQDYMAHHVLMLEQVFKEADHFDIAHFHIDYIHFPTLRRFKIPHVSTLHGRLDIPDLFDLYREFREMPVVSISDNQRKPLPWINWQGTIYHGLPEDLYTFREEHGKYLAFLGRISPEKRLDRAIQIAMRVGMEIKIAAKVDLANMDYFNDVVKPLFRNPLTDYIGEIGEHEKNEFLGNAYALLFPIDWPEPFGLVMIEAMACGTPVIAYRSGSVPEIIDDGVTGFLVNGMEEAVAATRQVTALSRRQCRQVFEERFSARRLAKDYLKLYQRMTDAREAVEQKGNLRQNRAVFIQENTDGAG
ncbi:MAG: glycosyltransferase family 4 protein [bacterium]